MSDKFYTQSLRNLLLEVLESLDHSDTVFGLPQSEFFIPSKMNSLKITRYGETLATPYGVAAGPHTQLSRNIVASWLMGARYIELKTVQTLDEIEVKKPCIDMQDEGYNCEWSQELKIKNSFNEYLNAWIVIHIINHKMDWGSPIETIFNMSVGYDLQGIMNENVQWFFDNMADCSFILAEKIKEIQNIYPAIDKLYIPNKISNNITLSTMHGCPPNEIEEISAYLIREKKLHTTVKLNPTLLGPEKLRYILNEKLAYPIEVPQEAFHHDIKYADALSIIKNLWALSQENNLHFAIKLTNTLEVKNNKKILAEEMNYMSGRALHVLSVSLAAQLQEDFHGELPISFSGGAHAFNLVDLLKGGLSPVTVSSDLLKPGAYGRLQQYYLNLWRSKEEEADYWKNTDQEDQLDYLKNYAQQLLQMEDYKYQIFESKDIKSQKPLNSFDCIEAPCMQACPTEQDIPDYLHFAAQGNFNKALDVIYQNNPFPYTLGLVCEHSCQTKCTRINYDKPLRIRDLKEFIALNGEASEAQALPLNGFSVAVIGAGPSGLSAAWFMALQGWKVTIYEKDGEAGGLPQQIIPDFRLQKEKLRLDIKRILDIGVQIHYNSPIDTLKLEKLSKENDYVYFASGAPKSKSLNIKGSDVAGVRDSLKFLRDYNLGIEVNLGEKIIIIGGGNTAMDVARTANKIKNKKAQVYVVYRRSIAQMPAEAQEIKDALEEGVIFSELLTPVEIIPEQGVYRLKVQKMHLLTQFGDDGRQKVAPIDGEFDFLEADTIIPALGQQAFMPTLPFNNMKDLNNFNAQVNLYVGGDAGRGGSSIVQAVADGRLFAEHIFDLEPFGASLRKKQSKEKTSERKHLKDRNTVVNSSYPKNASVATFLEAQQEAARCLQCNEYCNICVSVCPNRANESYTIPAQHYRVQDIDINDLEFTIRPSHEVKINQEYQVYNIGDYCNQCGNCSTFCPTIGAPYLDKPQIHLSRISFEESSRGYFMQKDVLLKKEKNNLLKLRIETGKLIYEDENVEVVLTYDDLRILDVYVKKEGEYKIELDKIVEMKIMLVYVFLEKQKLFG